MSIYRNNRIKFSQNLIDRTTVTGEKIICDVFFSAYEPTNQYDLYDAFMKAINEDMSLAPYTDFNFTEYYRTWVNEPGYPILYVNVDHSTGDIALRQVINI